MNSISSFQEGFNDTNAALTNLCFSIAEEVCNWGTYGSIFFADTSLAPVRMMIATAEATYGVIVLSISLIALIFDNFFDYGRHNEHYIIGLDMGCEYLCHGILSGIKAAIQSTPTGVLIVLINDLVFGNRFGFYISESAQRGPHHGFFSDNIMLR